MTKRWTICLTLAMVLMASTAWGATWTQGKDNDWTKSSYDQAADISGVSVGPRDSLHIFSGTTHEWLHAVVSGVSDIWPLAGGGVTGFRRSDHLGRVFYVGDTMQSLSDSEVAQLKTLAGGATPYTPQGTLTAHTTEAAIRATGFAIVSEVHSQVTNFVNGQVTSVHSQVTAYVAGQVTSIHSQVTSFVNAQITLVQSQVTAYVAGQVASALSQVTAYVSSGVSTAGVSVYGTGPHPTATILPGTGVSSVIVGGPNHIYFQVDGTNYMLLETAYLRHAAGGWALINATASETNPNITPTDGDSETGIGGAGSGVLTIVSQGKRMVRTAASGVILYYADGIPAIVVDSGTSTIQINDSSGVSQMTIDVNNVHGKTPLSGSALTTKTYVDGSVSDAEARVTTFVVDRTSGTSAFEKAASVCMPDQLVATGNSIFIIAKIGVTQFPSGVTLVGIGVENSSGTTSYTVTIEEWSGTTLSYVRKLGEVTSVNGNESYLSGATEIAAGKEVRVSLPSTAAYIIHVWLRFFRR